jgi:hypothetical protein
MTEHRTKRMRSPTANRRLVERWNVRYPVGVQVLYHPVLGQPETILSLTRDPARMLGDNAVVSIAARTGVVSLWHCEPSPLGTFKERT